MTEGSKRRPIVLLLASHGLSLAGVVLVTTAGFLWLVAIPALARGHVDNPYTGILLFLVLPAVFFAGLALIPIGVVLARRKVAAGLRQATDPAAAMRRLGVFLAVTTLANVVIGSQLVERAVHHMETPQFCGDSCHVMRPERTAHAHAAHSRVACVECHVAPGTVGWVHAKINGLRQLYEVTWGSPPKPIPAGLASERLVGSGETCERCHAASLYRSPRIRAIPKVADDEANTLTWTVLSMRIADGASGGIHGTHLRAGTTIRFVATDATRATIPWVEVARPGAPPKAYFASGATKESVAALPVRTMQCVDCHNRPAHTLELPERAVDRALAAGALPASLPFFRREAVRLLREPWSDGEAARRGIADGLTTLFPQSTAETTKAAKTLTTIWSRNVFPDLAVTWGTYPSNVGHEDSPGCFRCHDGEHAAADGSAITNDCEACHATPAVEELNPEILKTLALGP